MSPLVAKLIAAGLAIAAIAATHFVKDPTALTLLNGIAGVLLGKEFFGKTGDVAVLPHPDDMSEK